ncbi:MAG: nucleoside triphosphate pyrophosphohydrolase [Fimbriimonadales bacterium]|nr:nucleoside triphosphate pyrophosphohydrolase [Fimbriimonadales bacterium]
MIYLVGLGASGAQELSENALQALRRAQRVFLVAPNRFNLRVLEWVGVAYESCPDEQEQAVEAILNAPERTVAVAMPGHPLIANPLSAAILQAASGRGRSVRLVPSRSFIEPALEAVLLSAAEGLQVLDARRLPHLRLDPTIPSLWFGIETPERLQAVQQQLLRFYPPEFEVFLIHAPGDESLTETRRVTLSKLTRMPSDAVTYLLTPPCPRREQVYEGFEGLVRVVAALRAPDGCPWDREQTHASLKPHLLEEVYETLEAIDSGDPAELREELGDLLLQVLMHSQMASETGAFDIESVVQYLTEKLISRHPHVFGSAHAETAEQVLKNWDKTKRAQKGRDSILEGVPRAMPALARAQEISKRAARVGFEWDSIYGVLDKLREEENELRQAIESGDSARVESEIGDLLFTVVNIARHAKVDAEDALRTMVDRFTRRFQWMEAEAARRNRPLESLSAEEWEALWQRAKESAGG